jgi:hypothetical protein
VQCEYHIREVTGMHVGLRAELGQKNFYKSDYAFLVLIMHASTANLT